MEFKLHSEYKPTGDQPQAIEALAKGFEEGNQFETLVGVTGSGKTFTMLNPGDGIIPSTISHIFNWIENLKERGWNIRLNVNLWKSIMKILV